MADTTTASILFCDLVGSTARFSDLGDDSADEFVREFLIRCRAVVERHDGVVVKTLGDGLMAVFERRTLDAVETALELHIEVADLDVADPPRLRVGLSVGEVRFDAGDWYGRAVTEASRLCSVAEPGTTLATEVVRTILGSRGQVRYVTAGARQLKGIPEPVIALLIEAAPPHPAGEPDGPVADGAATASLPPVTPVSGRSRSRWIIAAGVLAVVAIVAGALAFAAADGDDDPAARRPSTDEPAYRPTFEARTCEPDADDPSHTCGVLNAPMDRSKPSGRWIEVPVDVWAPIADDTERVALELGRAVNAEQSATRMLGRHIRLGARGRVGTPTLTCPEVTEAGLAHLLEPLYGNANVSAHVGALRQCRNRWTEDGIDVARFGNADMAADVQDAIVALDLPPIDLIAGTDQTPAAYGLMRDHPSLLRTATLVNPEAPDMSSGQLVTSFRTAFQAYASLCAADERCNSVLPDPVGRWNQLYAQFQATPSLQVSTLPDGRPLEIVIDGDRGASALEVAVGSTPLIPYLHLVLTGDAAAGASGNAYEKSDTNPDVPIGADLSDICSRIAPNDKPIDGDLIERYAPFRSGRFRLVSESCAAWNVPPASVHFRSPVVSAVPTTIVVGTLSTATNPTAVDAIARGLDRAIIFRFPTLGFAPMFEAPSCLAGIWRSWLERPESRPATGEVDACVASTPPVQFLDVG